MSGIPHRNSSTVTSFSAPIQSTTNSENAQIINMLQPITLSLPDSNSKLSNASKLAFYHKYSVKSIFVSLITLTMFKLVTDSENTSINFQGANAKISYFAVNILPISTIYKNIPYYTFPDKNYWTVIQITPDKSWVDEVTFFSITPYIGQYTNDSNTEIDYLANVNTSFNSVLLNGNDKNIFNSSKTITIIYTFLPGFQRLTNKPENNVYSYLLPNEYENANFSFITRFEKKDENTKKLNVAQYFKTFSFSGLPTNLQAFSSTNISNTTTLLKNQLTTYQKINTDYAGNKENIDQFISLSKQYDQEYQAFKIYPYFYVKNNNHVVTNFYQLADSDSTCNALINDYNKNYYNSEIITIRNETGGDLLYTTLKVLALNHVNSGYATTANIQVYDVASQKSLQTFNTTNDLPELSNANYPTTSYSVEQTTGIYELDIDLTNSMYDDVTEIAVFERVCYPPCTELHDVIYNSGPRYTSFQIITDDPRTPANSSTTDSEEIVTNNYIYTIESNDSNFSLNLNYNPYSTMNFRVFAPSS